MIIRTELKRKEPRLETERCQVEKIIELPESEFESFRCNLLNDYSFISENKDMMHGDTNGLVHCLLVLGKGREDGVLVDSEGSDYARYAAHINGARGLVMLDRYPALREYAEKMSSAVDRFIDLAIKGQQDGIFQIPESSIADAIGSSYSDRDMLIDMLSSRPEIALIEESDQDLYLTVAPEHAVVEDESKYRRLSEEEIEIICAKHVLWVRDAGGEQADFSGCLIKDVNLHEKNLINAIFDNSKLVNVNFYDAQLCFASFAESECYSCSFEDAVAEEADFKSAKLVSCTADRAIFTHSNFAQAQIVNCSMHGTSLQNCCLDETDFGQTDITQANTRGASYSEEEWEQDMFAGPSM